ncbi:hypothetical protein [Solidesulfovibrio carbinolicus]|uniref:hypothetical protein n=1 Tax=Solidesulfovibrio carbinolicus TaxID=296842 RepID=UPI0010121BEF|nr:hypothetical protein [Solidesulfovibrio carbinolicus]
MNFFELFTVTWTLIDPILSLGLNDKPQWISYTFLFFLFITPPIAIYINRQKKQQYYSEEEIPTKITKTIIRANKYLQTKNFNSDGQRMRHLPSLMETCTVIGAILLSAQTTKKKYPIEPRLIRWIFNELKCQFKNNNSVEFFDCSGCHFVKGCNIKYFDYLSHFYYAKNTFVFDLLIEEFSFLTDYLFLNILETEQHIGWPRCNGLKDIDPYATSTLLTLLSIFNTKHKAIPSILESLSQMQILSGPQRGTWPSARSFYMSNHPCFQSFPLITTHRCIEAFSVYQGGAFFSKKYTNCIEIAADFLTNTPLQEQPVNYEFNMGIRSGEVLRGSGHVVQGLIKANRKNKYLFDLTNYIISAQYKDGSFHGRSNELTADRKMAEYTDLTAFLTRTLCLQHQYLSKSPPLFTPPQK